MIPPLVGMDELRLAGVGALLEFELLTLARIIHERLRKLSKERAISIVPDVPRPDARGPS